MFYGQFEILTNKIGSVFLEIFDCEVKTLPGPDSKSGFSSLTSVRIKMMAATIDNFGIPGIQKLSTVALFCVKHKI